MKYLLLLLFTPLFSIGQTRKIANIEGYKIFKIGSIIDTSKVVPDEKQFDGTEKWKVNDSSLLHNGNVVFNKVLITTFNDTVKIVRLSGTTNGFLLYSDYEKKYGKPIQKTLSKYKEVETATWKTGNTQIFFFTPEGTYNTTAVYSDINFLEILEKKKLSNL